MPTKAPTKSHPNPPATTEAYLATLPADRREAVAAIAATIRANADPVLREGVQYGMIGWAVPHDVHPAGYHCDPAQPVPFASVGSQKSHIGLYLFCLYTDEAERERFAAEWRATGKRLDMGKSCVRVKRLEDVPLEVLGRAIKRATVRKFLASYTAALPAGRKVQKKPATKARASPGKAPPKKTEAKPASKPAAGARRASTRPKP